MKTFTIWAAAAATFLAASTGYAVTPSLDFSSDASGYGVFESAHPDGGWVVIDDQAMLIEPSLKIRDESGVEIADVSRIEPGTPVRYVHEYRTRGRYVLRIRLLDELPEALDEEGMSDR